MRDETSRQRAVGQPARGGPPEHDRGGAGGVRAARREVAAEADKHRLDQRDLGVEPEPARGALDLVKAAALSASASLAKRSSASVICAVVPIS